MASATSSCLLSIIILISFLSHAASTENNGFSTQVIHTTSPQSPYHNPNLTRADRIRSATRRSYARQRYIHAALSNAAPPSDIDVLAMIDGSDYIMEYLIGKPPVKSYGLIDSGSDIFWLQCLPCGLCYKQSLPIYDPLKSSTNVPLTCDELGCKRTPESTCNELNICKYSIRYEDDSFSEGLMATETLIIGNFTWEHVVFGCGHRNSYFSENDNRPPGIIGFNRGSISLVSQWPYTKRFAYCFGDRDDIHANGYIRFGDVATLNGNFTPLLSLGGNNYMYYFVTLEGISVYDARLPLPQDTFTYKPDNDKGGFLIDTGTVYTFLNQTAFTVLSDELDRRISKDHFSSNSGLEVCYQALPWELIQKPEITFHFKGADLRLPTSNTWVTEENNTFCLGMLPSDDVSMLGNYQQQNVEVGYDLKNDVIHLDAKKSCS